MLMISHGHYFAAFSEVHKRCTRLPTKGKPFAAFCLHLLCQEWESGTFGSFKGDKVWLNIKKIWLPEGLSHKFLGPYAGPFKVLEKKFPNTYKLELPKNLKVHPTFHVSLLKLVSRDASRPNRERNSRLPFDLIHNE
jgi:hypothetical protein